MSLNLRQIRYFVAAAEAGKVVAAASAVGISPSAITEAIQELEETVGTPLVTRHRDGIKVTYDGYVFLQHCRNILSALTAATSAVGQHRPRVAGPLSIGVTITVAGYFLAAPLALDRDRSSAARQTARDAEGRGERALYPAPDRRSGRHHPHLLVQVQAEAQRHLPDRLRGGGAQSRCHGNGDHDSFRHGLPALVARRRQARIARDRGGDSNHGCGLGLVTDGNPAGTGAGLH